MLFGKADFRTSAGKILDEILEIVPEAKSVRSHSTTYSTGLLSEFAARGLQNDCNYFIPEFSDISLKPWKNWTGMTMIPYFWEDDVMCSRKNSATISELILKPGLKVFDFHPIHVFLNTENLYRYENSRNYHNNHKELIKHRFKGNGIRNSLEKLMEMSS